jgi:hypothetical protein
VHEKLHQSARDASLDHCLDLIVGTIRKVGDSPASVNQNLVVKRVDKLRQDRESGGNSSPIRLRSLATAEVTQSPCSVTEHAKLAAVAEKVKEGLESPTAEDIVTAVRAVTSNVAKSPNGLFSNIGLRAGKKLDENRDSAGLNDDLGLGGRAGGNVGQGPSSLELDKGVRGSQELDKRLTTPVLMTSSIGGLRSLDRSFRNFVVA